MELYFSRNDLLQTAPTKRGSLAVLPASRGKQQQKVVIGDTDGVLQCFGFKKTERVTAFKELPKQGQGVTTMSLGEGVGQEDKVFVARGATLCGVSRKGKEFFRFSTNITEDINRLSVAGVNVHCAGDYVYNYFKNNKEAAYYMAPDRINDMAMLSVTGSGEENPLLACQDRHVRLIEGSEMYYEAGCDAAVTTLKYVDPKDLSKASAEVQAGRKEVLYGTDNGVLAQLFLDPEAVRRGWVLPNTRKVGGVTALSTRFDFTNDGTNDIVVGRDDGTVEVHCFDVSAQPQLVYEKCFSESVTTLDGGFITSPAGEDVLVQTFSGKVIALCGGADSEAGGISSPAVTKTGGGGHAAAAAAVEAERKARALRREVELLYDKVETERRNYGQLSEDLIAVNQNFRVNDKFILNGEDSSYSLVLETPVPIFTVAVHADVPVDLMDVPNNYAILSRSPPDPENGAMCLATYRCQESVNRLEIKIRTIEGQFGTFRAYIIPRLAPKTCQECQYRIKPLCLHQRVQSVDESRPLNQLRFEGEFTLMDMHTWIGFCIPEIPPKVASQEMSYFFRNVLLGTVLTAQYREGEAVFRSDSITTLAVLRETITREATQRKVRINLAFDPRQDLKDESIPHFLQLLHPKLEFQRSLSKKVQLIEALREIKMQEDDVSFLAPEYSAILEDADRITEEFKHHTRQLDYLYGIVKDLFIDWHKFKGANVKPRIPQLEQHLAQYDLDALTTFVLHLR